MELPNEIRIRFQHHGRRGGRARAERLTADARRAIARHAAVRRWVRTRFGDASFEALGLPGGAMIDQGLDDLAGGLVSPESLSVSLAAPRLRREGVPVPATCLENADLRLYRLLEETHEELAHARYLAHLRQVASFADACRDARIDLDRDAR